MQSLSVKTSQGEVYNTDKELAYLNQTYQTAEECKFSGIILTGRAENFAQLEGKEWIYASSIGASAPNQPYYQLDRE
ncbi:anti sigma factor C-terminal domain-containing protein [Streptococcus sp. DD11]|uniref:anti sigma factor C-terminal domain-containing protein n=1 Tax=Streptococcus sp. DD11 TaxID=1777879 RepID=UPI002407C0B3|nr:anti sigma factor C-terminal domain-containing protein [Streptococcus sp. DD11]